MIVSDAAGGEASIPQALRKVGAGFATATASLSEEGKVSISNLAIGLAALPGAQTVPRAEVWGLNLGG